MTDDALKIVAASSSKAFLRGSDFIVRYGREAEVALWHYRPGRWLGAPEEAIATMSQFVEQHLSVGAAVSVYSQVLSLSFSLGKLVAEDLLLSPLAVQARFRFKSSLRRKLGWP